MSPLGRRRGPALRAESGGRPQGGTTKALPAVSDSARTYSRRLLPLRSIPGPTPIRRPPYPQITDGLIFLWVFGRFGDFGPSSMHLNSNLPPSCHLVCHLRPSCLQDRNMGPTWLHLGLIFLAKMSISRRRGAIFKHFGELPFKMSKIAPR